MKFRASSPTGARVYTHMYIYSNQDQCDRRNHMGISLTGLSLFLGFLFVFWYKTVVENSAAERNSSSALNQDLWALNS